MPSEGEPVRKAATCQGCGTEYESRNAVFRHLKETGGACLPPDALAEFNRYILSADRKKVVILYGYLVLPQGYHAAKHSDSQYAPIALQNGQDAAERLLKALEEHAMIIPGQDGNGNGNNQQSQSAPSDLALKINRSYGANGSSMEVLLQDDGTGAISEVLATRLPIMLHKSLDEWIDSVNLYLDRQRLSHIRVFGRLDMPQAHFDASQDVSHRRMEYLMPADLLVPESVSLTDFFETLPTFIDGDYIHNEKKKWYDKEDNERNHDGNDDDTNGQRPKGKSLSYLYSLKKLMQSMTTQLIELDDEEQEQFIKQKRKRQRDKNNNKREKKEAEHNGKKREATEADSPAINAKPTRSQDKKVSNGSSNSDKKIKNSEKKSRVLRRKRFHNFTLTVMAHEFLSYRRMDRLYHRATLRFTDTVYDDAKAILLASTNPEINSKPSIQKRPFVVMSCTGDKFLNGQVCRVIGVLVAMARGIIDKDFVDCVFDEDYPHLVPTPEAPPFAMYAGGAYYVNWEGKVKKILTPRRCASEWEGWNDKGTLQRVKDWQLFVRQEIGKVWMSHGEDSVDGRLIAERKWTKEVLEPWAVKAREQLEDYRQWRKQLAAPSAQNGQQNSQTSNDNEEGSELGSILPPWESVDATVPALYEKVLRCLREADASGLWPDTTTKRQMVMVSTPCATNEEGKDDHRPSKHQSNLTAACIRASDNNAQRASAYGFVEGEGGASGSFSVGAMPGSQCAQPKGNSLFPELMKAAFELEIALYPDREPSSTIAINRNAQFRPHTDSGAGTGQSLSLIVALGTFVGGDLVVEGERKDIRYKAVEFDGWKQRHWTMPFRGERYSLVWFTPKGCEGVHGIDLCQ